MDFLFYTSLSFFISILFIFSFFFFSYIIINYYERFENNLNEKDLIDYAKSIPIKKWKESYIFEHKFKYKGIKLKEGVLKYKCWKVKGKLPTFLYYNKINERYRNKK